MWRRSAFSGLLDWRCRLGCSRSLGCWCGSFRAVRLNDLMQGKTLSLHSNHATRPRLVIWLWRKPEFPKLPRGSIYWGMRELLSSWTFTWSQTTIGLPPPLHLNNRATLRLFKKSVKFCCCLYVNWNIVSKMFDFDKLVSSTLSTFMSQWLIF